MAPDNVFNFFFFLLFTRALNIGLFTNRTRSNSYGFLLVAKSLKHSCLEVKINIRAYVLDVLISSIYMIVGSLLDGLLIVILNLCTKVVQLSLFEAKKIGLLSEFNDQIDFFPVLYLIFIFLLALVT